MEYNIRETVICETRRMYMDAFKDGWIRSLLFTAAQRAAARARISVRSVASAWTPHLSIKAYTINFADLDHFNWFSSHSPMNATLLTSRGAGIAPNLPGKQSSKAVILAPISMNIPSMFLMQKKSRRSIIMASLGGQLKRVNHACVNIRCGLVSLVLLDHFLNLLFYFHTGSGGEKKKGLSREDEPEE